MIQIKTQGEALDLPSGFSMEVEDTNPIFNDRGSQSLPATVPATRRNIRLLAAPHRPDADIDPNLPARTVEVVEGAYIRRGTMNITEAGKEEGISFNVGFDNSTAYAKWQKKKLSELDLPTYKPDLSQGGAPVDLLLSELYRIYRTPDSRKDDFAVFPLALNSESTGTDDAKRTFWEVLNLVGAGKNSLAQPATMKRLIDGEVTEVSVPAGYMVSPFLRVWRVLELIFDNLDLRILKNPFIEDVELSRLVILNNAADSICRGEIKYSDLMPDSTVEEFLNALWVRFGLVYNIDENKGTVSLRLLKDIIGREGAGSLDAYAAGTPKITYGERQYVKLSAATSIEGAAPACERFEDFAKGLDVSKVRLGSNVAQWKNNGSQENPSWSGETGGGYYEDYNPWEDPDWEEPDPPEPDYPEPDDDRYNYSARSAATAQPAAASASGSSAADAKNSFLAREFVTGQWYRLDATNGKVRSSSSSFFNWDPQPEGLAAFELSSEDECVPIGAVNIKDALPDYVFHEVCPQYLFGSRHYHSYIKGSDESGTDGDRSPLSFLFAYTVGQKTYGRITPEAGDGRPLVLDDGTTPRITLLFQFSDGLFAKFWAGYDEILRHGNRSIEVKSRFNSLELPKMNILDPYTFKGIRVLIDTMTYSLPSGREIAADLKLRTIQAQGSYDIRKEQNIPGFAAAARHLEWKLYSDTFGSALDTAGVRSEAIRKYKEATGYHPHGTSGDYWFLHSDGAILKRMGRLSPVWQTDPAVPEPTAAKQRNVRTYKALLTYDIFETHDLSQGDEDDRELDETPLGEVSVTVTYQVVLYSTFVND